MTHTSSLDAGEVRTVVHLADHVSRLREAAISLQGMFATRERGFFTPSEDDQVLNLWVSYHKSRAALLELIDSVRRRVGEASEGNATEFAVAYAAALVLVDAARCLRDRFGDNELVRGKLNESYELYGIQAGSFDAIQMSLTDPANALQIKIANEFYDQHRDRLNSLAADDEGLREVIGVIDALGEATRVSTARYLRARASERGRDTVDRILLGSFARMIYTIQQWGSCLVSSISTMPDHVPFLPPQIAETLQQRLRAGDVLVTRKENAATNYFLPGYWPHAAMYVGDDCVIESLKDGVRRRSMDSPLGNDAVVLIRPKLDESLIGQAIARACTHVGKPYDFNFDFTRADRLVCTEVVYRSYEGLGGVQFELTRRAGRQTLSAEDLLNLAIREQSFEQVAVYCPRLSDQLLSGDEMTNVLRQTMADPVEG